MARANLITLFELITHLLTPDGIQASSGELYRGAIFGRDSLRVALDLLPWLPSVGERVIFSLLRYQGVGDNPVTEEQPGRIHHEYRHMYVGGRRIGERQQQSLAYLSERWSGSGKEVIYYGSVDATPQLVRLVCKYCATHGSGLLDEVFMHRDGQDRTVHQALLAGMQWITTTLDSSPLYLVEFQSRNPSGLFWQVMRDGKLSYIHENGTLANRKGPVASLEVQGLAYDALVMAATLLESELPKEARAWRKAAKKLQRAVLDQFWLGPEEGFAMAIDRDKQGNSRLVKTASSVMAELLESQLLIDLPEVARQRYVTAIVKQMYSSEFLTAAGIRNRSLHYSKQVPLWDYHGSHVSWVVITNIFALGLRNHGLVKLAEDMENRLINTVNQSDAFLEFYYVDDHGQVFYTPQKLDEVSLGEETEHQIVLGTNVPEDVQAWTVSALLRILLNQQLPLLVNYPSTNWSRRLEKEIEKKVKLSDLLTISQEQRLEPVFIHVEAGRKLQEEFLADS